MILTCLSLVMSDVNRDLVSGTAGARRVHVHGETIVASAQRGRGNRQAGTHACAGGWRDKKRDREERERERNEKKKERKRETLMWDNIATNYMSRSLTPRLLEETKENETRV